MPTRQPHLVPPPEELWRRSDAAAAHDRMHLEDDADRYYAFYSDWSDGQQMARMHDGSGDEVFIGFSAAGVFIKGFAHESNMSPARTDPPRLWPGMFDACPELLASFCDEPAFNPEWTTFCLTWDAPDPGWKVGVHEFPDGRDVDGSVECLDVWIGGADHYARFAHEYYETEAPDFELARRVFAHEPLDVETIVNVGADDELDPDAALAEILEMGYGEPFPF